MAWRSPFTPKCLEWDGNEACWCWNPSHGCLCCYETTFPSPKCRTSEDYRAAVADVEAPEVMEV
eukprot:6214205-Pleurochrysis_carterae.AAC.2